ncbi:MAG: dihydrodipicolinate synthase family protein [Conexivisphaerales archaeon]
MITGIIPAVVLPMNKSAEPDLDEYKKYLGWVTSAEVTGVAVNVDTGEGPNLTSEERRDVIRVARATVGGKMVIAGIIGTSTNSAIAAAAEAKRAGANAGLVFPNSSFAGLPLEAEGPLEYHRALSEGNDFDIVLFQLQPSLGGIEYPLDVLLKLAKLKKVVAIKEATFDARKFFETLSAFKKHASNVSFLTGNDNFIFESFVLGADGALIGFGTLPVKDLVRMFKLVKEDRVKEASEIWQRLRPLMEVIYGQPVRNYRARTKYALSELGVISEKATYMRPPLLSVTEEEKKAIRTALKSAELL